MDAAATRQLAGFIGKYSPEIGALARKILTTMRARLPGALELVYDNYNGLAVVFGPSERVSDAIFSVVLYPRWVSLFFTQGARLPDPERCLRGSGKAIRHIVLEDPALLDTPAVRALMARAVELGKPFDTTGRRRVVIKSVSARQRPRRPGTPAKPRRSPTRRAR